jgi:hypothetical protein
MQVNNSPVPYSDETYTFHPVPKGLTVRTEGVRQQKGSRHFVLSEGEHKVIYVRRPKGKSDREHPTYAIRDRRTGQVFMYDGDSANNLSGTGPVGLVTTPDEDDLWDQGECPDDGKTWGWFGLDWMYEKSDDVYVRIRRMQKVNDPSLPVI